MPRLEPDPGALGQPLGAEERPELGPGVAQLGRSVRPATAVLPQDTIEELEKLGYVR